MVMPKKDKEDIRPPFTRHSLIDWRNRMGYSTRDAAFQLGCSREALASWERGDTEPPKYIGLACDALALGIGVEPFGE